MNILRRFANKNLNLRRPFTTTTTTYEELLDGLPFVFNAELSLIDRLDGVFQTSRSINNDIITNKDQINKARRLYLDLFKAVTSNTKLDENKYTIEPRLLNQINENIEPLKRNNLKIGLLGSSILGKSEAEIQRYIDVRHLGYLKVFNIDRDRKKNSFIHQYQIEKKEDELFYTLKEDPRAKLKPKGKKQKQQEEMMEALETKEERPVRDAVMWTAKKVGFVTPEELAKEKTISERFSSFKSMLYGKVETNNHILVEDYEILSPLGLYIQDTKTGAIVKSEGKDGGSFRHFIRVESMYDFKDAPSIRKAKNIFLTDIDFFLRGNPHVLVKNFIEYYN